MLTSIALIVAMQMGSVEASSEVQPPSSEADVVAATELAAPTLVPPTPIQAPTLVQAPMPAEPQELIHIPRDTPVRLMVLNEVSTKDHQAGHRFRLRVDEPVIIGGDEVIPIGTTAWGELLDAKKSGNAGKSGKLSARLLYLELDGREITLDGDANSEGKSGKGETILGVIGMGPFGLFAKGNNAKLKAGDMITGFIAEDVMHKDATDTGL